MMTTAGNDRIRARTRLLAVTAAAVSLVLLVSCSSSSGDDSDEGVPSAGGGDDSGASDSSDDATSVTEEEITDLEDTLLEYAQCMRDNGDEDFPDPDIAAAMDDPESAGPFGEIDTDSPEFQAANEVCQDILAELNTGAQG